MGGNLGMIIPTLIGQNRQAEQAQQQQDDQAVDQQVAIYNHIIQDPNAPPHLKDPAIQHTLDLVEDHGGKDVQDSLPQLGSILTNLSRQSILQGHVQKLRNVANLVEPGDQASGADVPRAAPRPFTPPTSPPPAEPDMSSVGMGPEPSPTLPGSYLQVFAGLQPGASAPPEAPTRLKMVMDPKTGGLGGYQPVPGTPPPTPQQKAPPQKPPGPTPPPSVLHPVLAKLAQTHLTRMQKFGRAMAAMGAGLQGRQWTSPENQLKAQIQQQQMMQAMQQQQIEQRWYVGQQYGLSGEALRDYALTGNISTSTASLNESPMMARLQSGKVIPILRSKTGDVIDANSKQPIAEAYPNDPMVTWGTPAQVTGATAKLPGQAGQIEAIDTELRKPDLPDDTREHLTTLRDKMLRPSAAQQELDLDKGEAEEIAKMLMRGQGSARMTGLSRRSKTMVEAILARKNFDLWKMEKDQDLVDLQMKTMNSFQMVNLVSRINFTAESLDKIDNPDNPGQDLIGQLEQTFGSLAPEVKGKYKAVNRLFMEAAANGAFEKSHPGSTKAAQLLQSQIAEIQDEIAAVYMGTGAPTDRGLDQAKNIIQGNWSSDTLRGAMQLTRGNLFTRQMSIQNAVRALKPEQMPGMSVTMRFNRDGLKRADTPGQRPPQSIVKMYVQAYGSDAKKELLDAGWGDN